jgi:hypothetical protein
MLRTSRTRLTFVFAACAVIVVAACGAEQVDIDGSGASNGTGGDGGTSTTSTGGESAGGGFVDPCEGVDCPAGEVCHQGMCVQGCSPTEPCAGGLSCCNGACLDVANDLDNCGQCDKACPQPPNVAASCEMGVCQLGSCDPGYNDCDGDPTNGCETMNACSCTPGETQSCYPGPPGTQNNAPCTGGTRTCNQTGTAWSLCSGFVLPSQELCANGIDEDCNGVVDDVPDLDGDGWTACNGDCCETTQDCSNPALVNPGAFEYVGNGVNDDCDAATSDTVAAPLCSSSALFTNVTPNAMAQAMDICQTTTANPPLPQKKWGLINASYRLANGNNPNATQLNNMQSWQGAVLQNYGTGGVVPQVGSTMAGISTGRMRDANDPGFVAPNGGTSFSSGSQPPASYLAAHGNSLPASSGCSGTCLAGSGANDSINLRLQIRVPTNALSFAYQFRFFTSEYWTFSCSAFNDFFLALLTSAAPNLPADKNISFDALGNPLSVNNGFFDICQAKGCYNCPQGFGALTGTGMELDDPYAGAGLQRTGGGTVWLQTTAPVIPGETMILELMVFDVSDNILDSLVLLDAFNWSIMPSSVGTGPPG